MNGKNTKAHLALLVAGSFWGLMSPIGKSAMNAGLSSLSLVSLRMIGAAVLFWIFSFFAPKETVPRRDLVLLFFAGLLSIVFNQGLFIFGLSLTSPIDASIIATSLPLITMVLATVFLKEPATFKKIAGVLMGASGAVMLVLSNYGNATGQSNIRGDVMCLIAQLSFGCYLTLFKGLLSRYHIFTLMKWMFTYATICFIPFSFHELSKITMYEFPTIVWIEVGYVVFFGTFVAYLLMLIGQKSLRPTVVSIYNYVQPIVATSVTVLMGLEGFGWTKIGATALIFTGVYLVTQSKSREQLLASTSKEQESSPFKNKRAP